jgi:protein TonB
LAPPVERGGLSTNGIDGDVTPLVRMSPDYPARAAEAGTEGWVQVRFSVTTAGTVRDATVVASEPGTTFDEAALKAVARWRYNPRVVDGVAVERIGLETVFRFELE